MHQNDIDLKKTSLRVGIILLIFLGLYYGLFGTLYVYCLTFVNFLGLEGTVATVITELTSGALYCVAFIVPAILYKPLAYERHEEILEPKLRLKFSFVAPIVFASVAIITAASYVNSLLDTVFGISGDLALVTETVGIIEFFVYTLTLAVVPAICEELLFRKTILRALLPYGEGFAIISSAVIFGLMHQNLLQMFYATMAGIVLGYAYTRTRSFLCVFLIHFTNNFTSVIGQTIMSNLDEPLANLISTALMVTVIVTGAISLIILMIKEKRKKDIYDTGCFGGLKIPSIGYVKKPTVTNPSRKFFLAPTVIIFTIICIVTCVIQLFA